MEQFDPKVIRVMTSATVKVRILRQKLLDESGGNCIHGFHSRLLENVLLAHHLNVDMAVVSVLCCII